MWQPDDGSAVPPELGMPGGNATVPNSRRDMQVGLLLMWRSRTRRRAALHCKLAGRYPEHLIDDMLQELVEASVRLATHPHIGLASAAASIRDGMQSGRGQRPPHMGRQVCHHELVAGFSPMHVVSALT